MSEAKKLYLGDSVYVSFDGYNVKLTTENGFGPSNTICLEPEVLFHLVKYATDLGFQLKDATKGVQNE